MEAICKTCGKTIERKCKTAEYCSKACFYKARRVYPVIKKTCPVCKKEFEVGSNFKHRKYCGNECSIKGRSGQTCLVERACIHCKTVFKIERWSKKKYCTFKCSCLSKRGKPNGMAMPESKLKRKRICRTKTVDGKQIFVHRLLMQQKIGRDLTKEERVHHINGDHTDNRIENLYLFKDIRSHQYAHRSVDKLIKPLLDLGVIEFKDERYTVAITFDDNNWKENV